MLNQQKMDAIIIISGKVAVPPRELGESRVTYSRTKGCPGMQGARCLNRDSPGKTRMVDHAKGDLYRAMDTYGHLLK